MLLCAILGIVCYVLAGISHSPYLSLIGCAVCGFSVGLMWPGTISLAGQTFKGGTAMFAVLAMSGDLGCALGPWLTGVISDFSEKGVPTFISLLYNGIETEKIAIKLGVLSGVIFPIITVLALLVLNYKKKRGQTNEA